MSHVTVTEEKYVVKTVDDKETIQTVEEQTGLVEVGIMGPQGPQGPEGPPGPGAATYIHEQQVPSDEWTIHHNLDKYPSVTVVDSANSWVVGDLDYVDRDTLVVTFRSAFAGKAYLN